MEVMERAFELEAAGARVIHLEVGEPESRPPDCVIEACQRALVEGETRYTDSRGLLELREAISVPTWGPPPVSISGKPPRGCCACAMR